MEKPDSDAEGRKLLTAVERIIASNASIRALVDGTTASVKSASPELKGAELRAAVATELVRHFSNRAAIAGGASALPALIPGWGSLVAAVGGTVAELTLLLKWEIEMALTLTHLYGFDIEQPSERQLAYLLASVGTYDAAGKNFFVDVLRMEGTAIWNYAPRRVGRILARVLTMLAALYLWRGFLKVIPVVGVVVGGSVNKLLTQKVGSRCVKDLATRRELMKDQARAAAPAKKPKRRSKAKRPHRGEPPAESLN